MYEADRELVARMRAGDQRAFDAFFAASAHRLAAFVARRSGLDSASVADVVQNALIKAVRGLAGYRGEAALHTWLTEICRHEIADAQRRAARRPAHDSLDGAAGPKHVAAALRIPEREEPPGVLDADRRRAAVRRALATLPDRYARVLEAKYGDGLSVEQIAQQLGATATAVQSLLARARLAFRDRWRADDGQLSARRSNDV